MNGTAPEPDALTDALVDAWMTHGLNPQGLFDYRRVSVAMIDILGDVISRQRASVRETMLAEFERLLRGTVLERALERETVEGLVGSVQ